MLEFVGSFLLGVVVAVIALLWWGDRMNKRDEKRRKNE